MKIVVVFVVEVMALLVVHLMNGSSLTIWMHTMDESSYAVVVRDYALACDCFGFGFGFGFGFSV